MTVPVDAYGVSAASRDSSEADRDADELVRRLGRREACLLRSDQLGLVDLEPAASAQAERAGVEPAAEQDDPHRRVALELGAQQVVDDAVPHGEGRERALQRAEMHRDRAGGVVHEALGVRVVRDRRGAGRMAYRAASVQ